MSGVVVDTHVKVLDERVRRLAIRRGIDAIVYAPHYTPWPTIVEQAAAVSDERLTVVPGRELFTGGWRNRTHVLALDLSAPIPDFLPLETTMDELDRQDACVLAPHPTYLTMSLSPDQLRRHRDQIDAIEVYNPKMLRHHHRRAGRLADRLDRPVLASSYAHLRGTVGVAGTRFEVDSATAGSIISAIRAGDIGGIEVPDPPQRWFRSASELAHLVWENTAKRVRRRGAGKPATHPTADVYGGRFGPERS